jgi:hypothetical protein
MKNGGRYPQEFFLEQRTSRFPAPVAVAVPISIPMAVAVIVTDSFTSSRKFTAAD